MEVKAFGSRPLDDGERQMIQAVAGADDGVEEGDQGGQRKHLAKGLWINIGR